MEGPVIIGLLGCDMGCAGRYTYHMILGVVGKSFVLHITLRLWHTTQGPLSSIMGGLARGSLRASLLAAEQSEIRDAEATLGAGFSS